MNKKVVISLYKKEMFDVIRDKKTIIMMILVPLFLYPCIMIGTMFAMTTFLTEMSQNTYKVAVVNVNDELVSELKNKKVEDSDKNAFEVTIYTTDKEAESKLQSKDIDALLMETHVDGIKEFHVGYLASNTDSQSALGILSDVLNEYSDQLTLRIIEQEFDDAQKVMNPIKIITDNLASSEKSMGSLVGMVVPFMLITSILMGTIYPAIDVTAGERERGTLETLMTLPIHNVEIMLSKFLSVSTVAVVSAILNMLSMSFVCAYMYNTISLLGDTVTDMNLFVYLSALIVVFICIIVFAMFTSAVCLCVCLFAKSFKEANNICTPILMVFMVLSMLGMIPTLELTPQTSLIPILNISLLIKKVFVMEYDYSLIMLVLASNLIYSTFAVMLMAKLFDSENILFGEGMKNIRIFERRSNMKEKQIPGYGDLVLMFGIMFLCMIYFGVSLSAKFGIWGTAACQAMILLIPVLYAWYMKSDVKMLFSIKKPGLIKIIGGVVLWLGAWLLEQVVIVTLSQWFPSLIETSDQISSIITDSPFPVAFLVVSVTPAIAEEAAFRGFLYGTLKKRVKPWIAILISAVLFGAYHMNWLQFIGATILGCAMAYAVYKSDSIFVSVIMHFINNGIAVLFQFYPDLLLKISILSKSEYSVVDSMILAVIGTVLAIIGIYLLCLKSKKSRSQ